MPQDDNAAASANARAGLSGLGDFLYKNSVTKPATQAATAAQLQQTDEQNQIFKAQILPAAQRQNDLDVKNLYLNTVEKPNASDKFPGMIHLPWDEAVQKNLVDPAAVSMLGQSGAAPPEDWAVQYNHSLPFVGQPSAVQDAMVDRVIAGNPSKGVPVTRAEAKAALANQDFRQSTATLPPITPYSLPGGLRINSLEGGPTGVTYKASNPGATPIPSSTGEGQSGYVMINGEAKPDPNALAPKDITDRQAALTTLQSSRDEVDKIQAMINAHPNLIGPGILSGGSALPSTLRKVGAYVGAGADLGKQQQLQQFLGTRLLDVLGQVHIGRVTELEWNQLRNNIPAQSAPKENWDDYLNRLQTALKKSYQDQTDALRRAGVPASDYESRYSSSLPPINSASSVQPPTTSRVGDSNIPGSAPADESRGKTVWSEAEFNALPKTGKTPFVWGPTGQAGFR